MSSILITSGCSFTHDTPTWANYLETEKSMSLINVAMSGAGNHIIASELIRQVEKLLNSGCSSHELYTVVQWSGLFRFDTVVSEVSHPNPVRPVHLANGKPGEKPRAFPKPLNTENAWIMSAGSRHLGVWPDIYHVRSKEQAFIETVENILRVQWYLKSKSIKYKMFTGWDIFTDGQASHLGSDKILTTNQFTDEEYTNIDHDLLSDNCKWFGYLFEMIDTEHFWFYNSDKIKYGGMLQWIKEHVAPADRYIRVGDFHPSHHAHERFASEVLKDLTND